MAVLGLSATREVVWSKSYQSAATLAEGACAVYSSQDIVTAPSGAAVAGVAGVVTNAGGVVSGDRADLQKVGTAMVLLAAGATVTIGQALVVANSSGHVRALASDTACTIVGYAEQAFTAGSNADPLMCTLSLCYKT